MTVIFDTSANSRTHHLLPSCSPIFSPPFTSDPALSQQILDGDLTDFQIQNEVINIIPQNLELLPDISQLPFHMSNEEFIKGMKLVKEGKSSSSSGRHYYIHKTFMKFLFTVSMIITLNNTPVRNNFIIESWKKPYK